MTVRSTYAAWPVDRNDSVHFCQYLGGVYVKRVASVVWSASKNGKDVGSLEQMKDVWVSPDSTVRASLVAAPLVAGIAHARNSCEPSSWEASYGNEVAAGVTNLRLMSSRRAGKRDGG